MGTDGMSRVEREKQTVCKMMELYSHYHSPFPIFFRTYALQA